MRILFLCGSLEPGRDGVGDYTQRLAGEIIRQGHDSTIVALNDKFVEKVTRKSQANHNTEIKVMRIPISFSWKERMILLKAWIGEVNPNWISLQYVPFSFHNKGLPFLLASQLKEIGIGVKWHIMFHELWVGRGTLKSSVLSILQKFLIIQLIRKLRPDIIHTHLPFFKKKLGKISNKVRELTLFSNFSQGPEIENTNKNKARIAFFNLVNTNPKIISFLVELNKELTKKKQVVEIMLIGGAFNRLKKFGFELERMPEFKDKVVYTGFADSEIIPELLQSCMLGVTPLHRSTLGKSGTSAAFLAQGIPLAVPLVDHRAQPFFNNDMVEALLLEPDLDKLAFATQAAKKAKKVLNLSSIAKVFIDDLDLYSKL